MGSEAIIDREEERFPTPPPSRRSPMAYVKAAWRIFRYLAQRERRYYFKRPIDTLFFLTYRCTSRCQTCTFWQRRGKEGEMTIDEWKKTIDMCVELGAKNYELFGGDALLRRDLLGPMIRHIKSYPGTMVDIVTNSNLMTREIAKDIVEAGIDDVWISMDGVEECHDHVRGRGETFTKVDNCISYLQEYRGSRAVPQLHANCTISNLNYNTFDQVLYYAEKRAMEFCHLEYAGEFWDELLDASVIEDVRPQPYFVRQEGRSILADRTQAQVIKEKVETMKRDARGMKIRLQTENVDRLTIEQMISGFCDNRRCYITRTKITVDPRGNLIGCPFYDGWKMGNVREKPLQEIWNNGRHKAFLQHFARGDMRSLCDHCIIGVQRNPTPTQNIRDFVNRARGKPRR